MRKVLFLTGGPQWTVPADWNNSSNRVIAIGGGGGGANGVLGGGGGGCSVALNMQLTPGATVDLQIGGGGAGGVAGAALSAGGDGGDTWLVSAGTLLAKGARGGYYNGSSGTTAPGGQAADGIGDIKFSGGYGGSLFIIGSAGAGGGGAASDTSDGRNGDSTVGNPGGDGGDSGSGVTGGVGGKTSAASGLPGGQGNEWTARDVWDGATYTGFGRKGGAGSGGGGGYGNTGVFTLGARGGGFGGGGGCAGYPSSNNYKGGAEGAAGGIIVIYDGDDAPTFLETSKAEIFFSQSVQEMLEGRNIYAALGVWFDFASGEERVWLGRGTFTARDGTEWSGLGELAAVDGIQSSAGLSTEPITMTLSGLDTSILDMTRAQASEIRGRRCGVYLLMFDENAQPIDSPYLIDLYLMDKANFTVSGETRQMSITVTAEPLFSTKHIPRFSLMTDQDQQTRYPGDKIFERVSLLAGRQTVVWSSDT